MFMINAITNGEATHKIKLENLPANATTEIALSAARETLIKKGIKYDEIAVSFIRVCVDIQALEILFLTPTDPALRVIEKGFEAEGRKQQVDKAPN